MRPLMLVLCALPCVWFVDHLPAGPPGEGASLAGVVTRAESGEPIAGARVILMPAGDPNDDFEPDTPTVSPADWSAPAFTGLSIVSPATALARATTGTDGRFAFNDIPSGQYRLVAAADGYVPREHGQRISGVPGTSITLSRGETSGDISLGLTPTGSIEGRLSAPNGSSLAAIPVYLWRYVYDSDGEPRIQIAGAALTDDRGAYRIFWIVPGKYFLSTGGPIQSNSISSAQWRALTIHPDSGDSKGAGMIQILPGSDQTLHWILPARSSFNIRAQVRDSRRNTIPRYASVSVAMKGLAGDDSTNLDDEQIHYDAQSGRLEVSDLVAGTYEIEIYTSVRIAQPGGLTDLATVLRPGEVPEALISPQPIPFTYGSARAEIRVTDANVDGVELDFADSETRAEPVSGRVTASSSKPPAFEDLSVVLHAAGAEPKQFEVQADGAFSILFDNDPDDRDTIVAGGEYRVTVSGLPNGWYIESADLDGADALTGATRFGGRSKLTIRISPQGGLVEGAVRDGAGRPVPGVLAVLIPREARHRAELYRKAVTDGNGRFRMLSIAPGDYAVFAWEALEPNSWFDPAIIGRFEVSGSPVRVVESSVNAVYVTIVPVEEAP